MLREMSTTYGRSPGGYAWAILEPAGAVAMLTLMFSLAMHRPSIGTSFALFYATGYLPFTLFNDMSSKIAGVISFSRPLLTYPAVTYIDALIARFLLTLLTHMVVGVVIFGAILLVFQTGAALDVLAVVRAYLLTAVLGLGVGLMNCYLMTSFPAWGRIWWVLTRPLFLVSGIFFTYDDLPAMAQDVLWYNPLLHGVGFMRSGFYLTYSGDYLDALYVGMVAALLAITGLLLVRMNYRAFLQP
ncbi:ABC transporter permease [Phaeovulum sp.]|uniref:ABC transporter permease n=1 Tax=Phaeovulum sp. TaxID=2934796 RepID=UPI0039E3B20A